MKRFISLTLMLIMCIALLSACGKKEEKEAKPVLGPEYEEFAGLYTNLGYYFDGQFVIDKDLSSWSVTLKKDATGSLFWGEDNKGPISEWSITDGVLTIHAGISVIEGRIEDGIMLLDMGDGITLGWAGPNTDFEKLNLTTIELFMSEREAEKEKAEQEADKQTAEQNLSDIPGTYYQFAKERDGYCIAMPEGVEVGRFILNEDGSAQIPTDKTVNEYTWEADGESISFKNKSDGELAYTGTVSNGILYLDVVYTNPDGSSLTTRDILAKEDADTSAIATISISEYNALPAEQKNG